ncbi:DNA repair protein RecO [Ketogulonicigenium vulgare]|uniref:DNA repair protein RecO n=1 Tax=Ketogulonicigenium vulgare TaxID=92945 RepID=UPI002358413A|nr:DNA repair protein RecO [Ketogulonicigenium vulgare]
MIDWQDEGILLTTHRHGEAGVIAQVFTQERGKISGLVRGGAGSRMQPVLIPGNQLSLRWRARLDDHLGSLQPELIRSRAGFLMQDRLSLAAGAAVTALLAATMPERVPHPAFYAQSSALLDLVGVDDWQSLWPLAYLQWEMVLLREGGFGLDLTTCAVTGAADDLCYVSPKSGRAVSKSGAGAWAERLLPLPAVMRGEGDADTSDILQALVTTEWFLLHRLHDGAALPAARARLIEAIARL